MSKIRVDKVPRTPRYAYAVNMAVRFLEENKVHELPLDIKGIIRQMGWTLLGYSQIKDMKGSPYMNEHFREVMLMEDAFCVHKTGSDSYLIVYDDSPKKSAEEIRMNLCHEVGHCYLHHLTNFNMHSLFYSKRQVLEEEAVTFARSILIPIVFFTGMSGAMMEPDRHLFGVSEAEYRLRIKNCERDASLTNDESLWTLKLLFRQFAHNFTCKNCGMHFLRQRKKDCCPFCGSVDLEWTYYDEYMDRRLAIRYGDDISEWINIPEEEPYRQELINRMLSEDKEEKGRRTERMAIEFRQAYIDELTRNPGLMRKISEVPAGKQQDAVLNTFREVFSL